MRSYGVNNGQLVSEIRTAVFPTAIPPIGSRFLGFLPDGAGATSGSTVLADLADGHILEVLNPAAHVLNLNYFNDDASAIVYIHDRDHAQVVWNLGIDDAVQILEQTTPPLNKSPPQSLARQKEVAKHVKLVHVATGQVLAVEHDSADAEARIVLAEDQENKARQWIFWQDGDAFMVANRQSGKVLDVSQKSADDGAPIIQYDKKTEDNDNQRWSWLGKEEGPEKGRRLQVNSSGLVLDVDGQGKAIQRKADEKAKSQLWHVMETHDSTPP